MLGQCIPLLILLYIQAFQVKRFALWPLVWWCYKKKENKKNSFFSRAYLLRTLLSGTKLRIESSSPLQSSASFLKFYRKEKPFSYLKLSPRCCCWCSRPHLFKPFLIQIYNPPSPYIPILYGDYIGGVCVCVYYNRHFVCQLYTY